MSTENRYYPRQNIDFLVSIQTGAQASEVRVKDMSVGGMRLEIRNSTHALFHNEEVLIHIPFISDVNGVIRWQENNTLGVSFECCPSALENFVESILPTCGNITTRFKA